MNGKSKPAGDGKKRRAAKTKSTFTTKSGTAIKLNRSFGERIKAGREARARRKAAWLATLPKNPVKRLLFRMRPKQLARYWFSRDGGIMALKVLGVCIVVGFVLIVGVFAYFRKDLPNITDLSGQTVGGSVTYYARDGQTILWQDYSTTKRQPVATDKMSKSVRQATVAIEDKDFYTHGAFDIRGIARAAINNLTGGSTQGASTISEQLAKLDQQWTAERTVGNKIKELILAIEMEREYSKEDILTGYLNLAPYGPVEVGVEAAAQDYFGVDAKNLSLAQAAMLAAIPKSPNLYSPYGPRYDSQALTTRQHYIIDLMLEQKMITKQQAEEAKAVDIVAQVKPRQPSKWSGIKAPSFVQAAKAELDQRFGEEVVDRGGWKVNTTLDMKLQDLAQKSINDNMHLVRHQNGDTAAFVAMDNATGQIVAAVGNGDNDIITNKEFGELNFVHSERVSPGSSFKPYDYATFIDNNNVGAGSVLYDSREPVPGYACSGGSPCLHDYDNRYPGPITIRYALAGSRNVPAVKAMLSVIPNDSSSGRVASINKTISTAESMMGNPHGYSCFAPGTDVSEVPRDAQGSQCYSSSAIGDGAYLYLDDHVTGLSTFARMGQSIPHTYLLKVTDAAGKTIYQFKQPAPKQTVKPDTAYIINSMLVDPRASYLGNAFHHYKGWDFAIKTGTTNDSFDGLMASWSTKYTAVTWVGSHTRTVALRGFMETMTRPIMGEWMEGAHDGLTPVNWKQPKDIQTLPAYVITNKISSNREQVPSPSTDIFPSWYKAPGNQNTHKTIDLVSQKTATECTPDLARSTEGEGRGSNVIGSVDLFHGGSNVLTGTTSGTQTNDAVDDVHNCNDAKPSITLTPQDGLSCEVGDPCEFNVFVSHGQSSGGAPIPLFGGSYTTSPAGTIAIIANGQTVQTIPIDSISGCDDSNCNYLFDYQPASGAGTYELKASVVDSILYSATSNVKSVTYTD